MKLSKRLDKLRGRLIDLRWGIEDSMSQYEIAEFNSIEEEMWGIVLELESIGDQL